MIASFLLPQERVRLTRSDVGSCAGCPALQVHTAMHRSTHECHTSPYHGASNHYLQRLGNITAKTLRVLKVVAPRSVGGAFVSAGQTTGPDLRWNANVVVMMGIYEHLHANETKESTVLSACQSLADQMLRTKP